MRSSALPASIDVRKNVQVDGPNPIFERHSVGPCLTCEAPSADVRWRGSRGLGCARETALSAWESVHPGLQCGLTCGTGCP